MILIFIILVIFNMLFNMDNLLLSVYDSLNIWFHNIYPSIFISYMISSYLINNALFSKLSFILKYLIKFDSHKSYSLLFINIFLGNPGTSKLINNALKQNEITTNDYIKLCDLCNFVNPFFLLIFLPPFTYLIYLIVNLIYIFIYSLFNSKKKQFNNFSTNYSYSFSKSINDVISILLNVACLITLFNIIKTTLIYYLDLLHINNIIIKIILSFLEISSGLQYLSKLNINILSIILISFQGLCILIQSFNCLDKKNISFKRYILIHILSSIIITILYFIITTLFHI